MSKSKSIWYTVALRISCCRYVLCVPAMYILCVCVSHVFCTSGICAPRHVSTFVGLSINLPLWDSIHCRLCTLPCLYASVHHFISLFHLHVVHALHVLCVFLWMQWTVLHSTQWIAMQRLQSKPVQRVVHGSMCGILWKNMYSILGKQVQVLGKSVEVLHWIRWTHLKTTDLPIQEAQFSLFLAPITWQRQARLLNRLFSFKWCLLVELFEMGFCCMRILDCICSLTMMLWHDVWTCLLQNCDAESQSRHPQPGSQWTQNKKDMFIIVHFEVCTFFNRKMYMPHQCQVPVCFLMVLPPPHGLREPCKLVDAKAKLGKTLQNDFGAKVLACHSPSVWFCGPVKQRYGDTFTADAIYLH